MRWALGRATAVLGLIAAVLAVLLGTSLQVWASAAPSPAAVAYACEGSPQLSAETRAALITTAAGGERVSTWAADPALQSRSEAATAFAAEDAGAVNAIGGVNNCVNCVIAGDATLAGAPASALDSAAAQQLTILERTFGGSFKSVSGQSEIEGMLSDAGPGSCGIAFGSRGADPGHVWNAVNQGGTIRFIDFQSGRAASFDGYQGFSFLWTTP